MRARVTLILLLRIALFAAATPWLLLAFPLAFAGMDGGNWLGLLVAVTPSLLVFTLASLGFSLGNRPHLMPTAVAALLISTALLAWVGYQYYLIRPRTGPPPLAQNYDLRAHDQIYGAPDPAQSARWTILLQKRFPIGSPVAELIKTLDAQRFDEHFRARDGSTRPDTLTKWHDAARAFNWHVGPCYYSLQVRWKAAPNGTISAIDGQSQVTHGVHDHCP